MTRDEAIRYVLEAGIALSYEADGPDGEASVREQTIDALHALGVQKTEMRLDLNHPSERPRT